MTLMSGPEPVQLVGLVADDLTGAIDAAVQFAESGWRTMLLRRFHRPPLLDDGRPTLLATSTGVRADSDFEAAERTAQAVRALVRLGAQRIYLKIDSTARGSVAGQIRGAVDAWGEQHDRPLALICPAFPELGRTVQDGVVLVHWVPVAETAAAADPVTPVTQSRLDELVPGSQWFDASSTADLDRVAARVQQLGERAIPVGSGGLAAAVARKWMVGRPVDLSTSPPAAAEGGRILVAISSLHPIALTQAEALRRWSESVDVELIMTPTARAETAAAAASAFADGVAHAIHHDAYTVVVLIGGDGAAAVLDRLGADVIVVDSNVLDGTPHGTVVGGPAHGLRLVTRSGGFGGPDGLLTLVRRLRAGIPNPPDTMPMSDKPSPKDTP